MRLISKLWLSALLMAAAAAGGQQQIDPTLEIQWNLMSGAGAPTAGCTQFGQYLTLPYGAQWGQPYINLTTSAYYVCGPSGWTFATAVSTDPTKLPLAGGTLTGMLNGTSASFSGSIAAVSSASSANKVLYAGAAPYNVKCDGTTDDTGTVSPATGIRGVFADAAALGYSVQFPAGTCLTHTISWTGTSFYGAGKALTVIQGYPGEDTLQGPNGSVTYPSRVHIHDITIQADGTVNASSTLGGGNGTYPNRVTGVQNGANFSSITSVGNASGGNTVYTGTFVNGVITGASNKLVNANLTFVGCTNSANNGTYLVSASSATQVTVNNASGTSEASSTCTVVPTALSSAQGGAPSPGPVVFGPTVVGGCSGSSSASSANFTLSCGVFQDIASSLIVGAPITVNGAGTKSSATAYSITSNVVTFTVSNSYTAGEIVYVPTAANGGFATSTFLNNTYYTVLAAGLSGSQFEANFTHANASATETGAIAAPLVTTISSVTNQSVVVLTVPASTTNAIASGQWGNALTSPWYVGNCAMAIPQDTPSSVKGVNGWHFENVAFSSNSNINNTCGFLMTAQANDMHFTKVDFQGAFYGYVEYLTTPEIANSETPDTSSYTDVNLNNNYIAAVMYNGGHRTFNGVNIYTGQAPLRIGFWWFNTESGDGSFTNYYHECYGLNSGEMSRFGETVAIVKGSLGQCGMTNQYINFLGTNNIVNAQVANIHLGTNAGGSKFFSTLTSQVAVTDAGYDNSVSNTVAFSGTGTNVNGYRNTFINRPREPLGKVDAGFLMSGNSATPFTSSADLIATCTEFNFALANSGGPSFCTADLNDSGNPFGSYAHLLNSAYTASPWYLGHGSGHGNGPIGKDWIVGDRVPKAATTLVILARCDVSCTQTVTVYDTTASSTNLGSASLTFGTSWTIQTIAVTAGTNLGDILTVASTAVPAGGATYQDIALIGFQATNVDTLAAAATATAAAISAALVSYAPLSSPALTGTPTTPNATCASNSTQVVNQTYVSSCGSFPTTVPPWLQFLGDGSDGAYSCTSGTCSNISGERWYTTFNVSSGAVQPMAQTGPTVIRATGACTIAGVVTTSANYVFGIGTNGANWAPGGGGGGGGTLAGAAGGTGNGNQGAGSAGAITGGNGGNGSLGNGAGPSFQKLFVAGGFQLSLATSSSFMNYGGGPGGAGGSSGGVGGLGSPPITIVCGSINFTGQVDVSGGYGTPASANSTGGGGGGGAGFVIMRSPSFTNSGIINVNGGVGGQSTVPYAVAIGGSCTTAPIVDLTLTSTALSGCGTIVQAGAGCGTGTGVTWKVLGGGGTVGTATITPSWSGGALASCTVSSGTSTGYTVSTWTTSGTGGNGGTGWSRVFTQ
ncbi:MAG: hypothetical protein WBQ94_04250 [Terracidiphilus sp.]